MQEEILMAQAQVVRCLNCFTRVGVPQGTKRLTCPECGIEYIIFWRGDQPKIAGTPPRG